MPLFLVSAALHEAAHLAVMRWLGSKPQSVRLIPGGINIAERDINTPPRQALILAAGPFSNLLLALLSSGDLKHLNILLFIFNMLPVEGLDGGRLLGIMITALWGNQAAVITVKALTLLLAVLFLSGFLWLLAVGKSNYSLIVFSLYLVSSLFLKKGIERKR